MRKNGQKKDGNYHDYYSVNGVNEATLC